MRTLKQKLDDIKSIMEIEHLLEEKNSKEIVKRYYLVNRIAYTLFHSMKGYVHMALSEDGRYHAKDLEKMPQEVENHIQEIDAKKVLELASGHGANTLFLAKRNPKIKFFASDLSTKPKRGFYKLQNTSFEFNDYHNLDSYKSNSFDLIFIFEALCHSRDKEKVLSEMKRLVRPDGRVVIFDGYYGKSKDSLNKDELLASKLTSVGMAVGGFTEIDTFEKHIENIGLEILEKEDITNKILPNVKRFEKLSRMFFSLGFLSKLIIKIFPDIFVRNTLAAYLMLNLLENEVAVYYKHVLTKKV
jgi:arsenite methyltransferase